jgi:hypothetical protein
MAKTKEKKAPRGDTVTIHGRLSRLQLRPPKGEDDIRAVMVMTIEAAVEDRDLIPSLARKLEVGDIQDITIASLQLEMAL